MSKWIRVSLVLWSVALAALVSGCDKGGGAAASKCVQNGTQVELSGNHGHAVDIPADHVKRGMGGGYAVKGGDHEHAIVLKDEDMKKLQAGESVTTRTSSVNGHLHEASISCK
ncbi:MAG: hypothetical protein IPM35_08650 [Myxococcales bacterium]|nr:hypothetical protein [Myxococcales bacterium]